jgi:hypothetical protein
MCEDHIFCGKTRTCGVSPFSLQLYLMLIPMYYTFAVSSHRQLQQISLMFLMLCRSSNIHFVPMQSSYVLTVQVAIYIFVLLLCHIYFDVFVCTDVLRYDI